MAKAIRMAEATGEWDEGRGWEGHQRLLYCKEEHSASRKKNKMP